MKKFDEFFLMTTEDAKRYAVEVLGRFRPDEQTDCVEIGDGNINYVFKIWSLEDGHSVIVKQADKLLRCAGRPLDQYRNKIEAQILKLEGELAPGYVPEVYYYDEAMAAVSMEDISAYGNLRKELMAGHVYSHMAENFSTFMADTLLPTTDLVVAADEKKQRVKFFTNPELCEITERLVLTEPFCEAYRGENTFQPENAALVEEQLYQNAALQVEVAKLRERFMNNAQALIHGDLHSGSIFANENGIKVIDPEFAFYGPMGYDIGNLVGNLFFSWANKLVTMPEESDQLAALEDTVRRTLDLTWEKMSAKYDQMVEYPFYKIPAFKESYLAGVMADTFGYAGTEMIRRTVGSSKVMELNTVTDPALRARMERILLNTGIRFVMERENLRTGEDAVSVFLAAVAD